MSDYAEEKRWYGHELLDSMIYHQETVERHLAGILHKHPNRGFTDGDEVLVELLEIVKEYTEGKSSDE
mgnify:FL=1|tara:strand:- start:2640 stop:2843 length:204 start_codon:yes stop_codon:yes gene_type:complete